MDSTKAKSFHCNQCKKSFYLHNQLIIHMRRHTGEKPYICEFCPKEFASSKVLKVHKRIHTGEKPYKCPYCEKSFTAYANLVVHRRIHTNEKPYRCNLCRRAFEHSGNLNRHFRTHMTDKGFRCILCSQIFTKDYELLDHTKNDHYSDYMRYIAKSTRVSSEFLKNLQEQENKSTSISTKTNEDTKKSSGRDNKSDHPDQPEENFARGIFSLSPKSDLSKEDNLLPANSESIERERSNISAVQVKQNNPQTQTKQSYAPQQYENSPFSQFFTSGNKMTELISSENSQEVTVASEYSRLKSRYDINQKQVTQHATQLNTSINLTNGNEQLDHPSLADPPPLIPISELEFPENTIKTKENPIPLKDRPTWQTNINGFEHFSSKNNPNFVRNSGIIHPSPIRPCLNPISTMPSSYQFLESVGDTTLKGYLKNFFATELSKFTFRKKVENVLILLFGVPKLRQFGYLQKSCEQVLISILDSIEQTPCDDVRVDEKDRFRVNVRLLLERSFPCQLSWDRLGWRGKSTDFILDHIIAHDKKEQTIVSGANLIPYQ